MIFGTLFQILIPKRTKIKLKNIFNNYYIKKLTLYLTSSLLSEMGKCIRCYKDGIGSGMCSSCSSIVSQQKDHEHMMADAWETHQNLNECFTRMWCYLFKSCWSLMVCCVMFPIHLIRGKGKDKPDYENL